MAERVTGERADRWMIRPAPVITSADSDGARSSARADRPMRLAAGFTGLNDIAASEAGNQAVGYRKFDRDRRPGGRSDNSPAHSRVNSPGWPAISEHRAADARTPLARYGVGRRRGPGRSGPVDWPDGPGQGGLGGWPAGTIGSGTWYGGTADGGSSPGHPMVTNPQGMAASIWRCRRHPGLP